MIWAMIQNQIIVNIVMASAEDWKDPNFIWVDITNLNPRPGIGWSYDGQTFSQGN